MCCVVIKFSHNINFTHYLYFVDYVISLCALLYNSKLKVHQISMRYWMLVDDDVRASTIHQVLDLMYLMHLMYTTFNDQNFEE